MAIGKLILPLIFALAVVAPCAAECCKRKGTFGCCGNGPCNIFCCNCDGGCNAQCENTSCDTSQWFLCASVVTGCAAECVDTAGAACIECMGGSYQTCKNCYANVASTIRLAVASDADHFAANAELSKDAFNKLLGERIVNELGSNPNFDARAFHRDNNFAVYDKDGSGTISRDEADCPSSARQEL